MSATARAAQCIVVEAPNHVALRQRAVPAPGPGQLRIRVVACGVCHRDLHIIGGRIRRALPLVVGHEPVGIVDTVGDGVTGFAAGQWVTGVGTASLSQYDLVEARHTEALRNAPVRPEHWLGEPAMCAVNAVNRAPALAGGIIVVCGAGFMGNLLVQAVRAKQRPSRLVAVDQDPGRLTLALEAGADEVALPDSAALHPLRARADLVFEASGAAGTLATCTALVRNGGVLAIFAHHFHVEPRTVSDWHLRGITVLNTVPWAAPDLTRELREAVAALEAGRLRMDRLHLRTIPLRDAATALCELAATHATSRKTVIFLPWED